MSNQREIGRSGGPRVLVAGLFHETNTFVEGKTCEEDFDVLEGDQMFSAIGSGSPLAGALEAATEFGWEVIPVIDMRAMPGPIVEDQVIVRFLDAIERRLEEHGVGVDGALLVLHGSMVSESIEDVEGHVLEQIRRFIGETPVIAGVLDLHTNFTDQMASRADLLVAYRTNPHIDAHESAVRAASILQRILKTGERPRIRWAHTRVLWPPTGTETLSKPMAELESRARQIEASDPEILTMNVLAGFAFADVPDAGVSFACVTVGSDETASSYLATLCDLAMQMRHEGNRVDLPISEVMKRVQPNSRGPILLVEAADNVGAGTSGRGLGVAKALVARGIQNSAVVIQAPEIVAQIRDVPLGERVAFRLFDPFDPEPLELQGTLASVSDGRFELEDPQSHLASMLGKTINMGPCAVVCCGGVRFLLTSRRTPPFDLGQFRSQGIVPEELSVVGIKAAVAHRRAWDPIASENFHVSTSGPCSSDLRMLPYRRLRRPIFPLDTAS